MASPKQSIVVEQYFNPKFDTSKPKACEEYPDNHEYVYRIERAVNYLGHAISDKLTAVQLQQLIDSGITVTVQPVKG